MNYVRERDSELKVTFGGTNVHFILEMCQRSSTIFESSPPTQPPTVKCTTEGNPGKNQPEHYVPHHILEQTSQLNPNHYDHCVI